MAIMAVRVVWGGAWTLACLRGLTHFISVWPAQLMNDTQDAVEGTYEKAHGL